MSEFEHEGLARILAKPYKWCANYGSCDADDVIQEARIAIWEAESTFDPNQGYAFSTYARYRARRMMQRSADRMAHAVRLPRGESKNVWLGQARFPRRAGEFVLESLCGDGGMGEVESPRLRERIQEAWAALPERLREVLYLRFVEEMTLEDVGARVGGVTRSRVQQLEAKALGLLREALR